MQLLRSLCLPIAHAECGRPTLTEAERHFRNGSFRVSLNIPKGTMKYYQNAITNAIIENAITSAIQIFITNAVEIPTNAIKTCEMVTILYNIYR